MQSHSGGISAMPTGRMPVANPTTLAISQSGRRFAIVISPIVITARKSASLYATRKKKVVGNNPNATSV
jgi:hypothetical protein